MNKRKICVVTGTRAEYGLLYWLMKEIQADAELELQIIATGMHLSPEFGLTYQTIEKDGFTINEKVEMLLSSDTPVGITKSIGLGVIGFADALDRLKPDIMVVLGDRYEIFAATQAAAIARIPIAHIHGGERTEGLIDEVIRHSITKMSLFHFTAAEEYRTRVIQMGEQPDRVFNVGAIGLDNIDKLELLSLSEFEKSINFKLRTKNFLITYHPVTLSHISPSKAVYELLQALEKYKDVGIIFTQANSDTDGRIINEILNKYVEENADHMIMVNTLGQLRYLTAIKYADVVVGNSSSGLIEVPAFGTPTVNIGDRQRGRLKGASVIDCDEIADSIIRAIDKALSDSFREKVKTVDNPYGNGNVSFKIVHILKNADISFEQIMKKFYDLEFKL
ncbi:GDP/UDP-N,N'-diacetylbacillosamine 2-epimerase (hydrolyzing) [bioreactor metagenome]|uniref:GDP/UDP-N,N'-diacetylbacillosamine 2-epimerase (Hydrolyzing) n=1 Tax=bioreactor metagenome TaxID=1076179 RepID=A0A644TT80_9ZZZZ